MLKTAHTDEQRSNGVWDYISPSRLNLWLRCPLAFRLRYIDGIVAPTTPSLFLGKMVHFGLEILYRHRQLGIDLDLAAIASRMAATAKEHDVPFLLLIIPSPIDVCEHYDIRIDRKDYPNYQPSRLSDLLVEMAVAQDIAHLNFFPHFQSADPDALYFRDGDDHWNDAGQKLAAELTAAMIKKESIVVESVDPKP